MKQTKSLQIFIAFQVHMSVVFLSDTFPRVWSWALVQTRWNLKRWMTLKISRRLRVCRPNPMKSKTLDATWNPLILRKNFTSASKSQKSCSKQKPSKIDHFVGSLIRDLGAKIQLPELQGFVSSAKWEVRKRKVQYVNNTRLPYESYPLGSQFQEKPLQPITRKGREGEGRVAKKCIINPVNQRWHLCSKFVPNRRFVSKCEVKGSK